MKFLPLLLLLTGCTASIDDRIQNRELTGRVEDLEAENAKLEKTVVLYHQTLEEVIVAYNRINYRCRKQYL